MDEKASMENDGEQRLTPFHASEPSRAGKQNTAGLQYEGKDPRGVSHWRSKGDWNGTLRVLGLLFVGYGAVAGVAGIALLLYALFTLTWPAGFASLFFTILTNTIGFGCAGLWALRMRKHVLSLATPAQLSERLNVPLNTLQQATLAKGIKPRLSINNEDYYAPADFGEEVFTLLRGASEPIHADVLLRAATGDKTDLQAQRLLRPAHDKDGQAAETAYRLGSQYSAEASAQTVQVSRE